MTKVDVFASPMVMARNPWARVGHAKKGGFYLRRPVPWDGRVGGYSALRPNQKAWIEGQFIPRAREAGRNGRIYQECLAEGYTPGTMGMNLCRIKKLGQELKYAPEPVPPAEELKPIIQQRTASRTPYRPIATPRRRPLRRF